MVDYGFVDGGDGFLVVVDPGCNLIDTRIQIQHMELVTIMLFFEFVVRDALLAKQGGCLTFGIHANVSE